MNLPLRTCLFVSSVVDNVEEIVALEPTIY